MNKITNIRVGKMTKDKPWIIDDAFSESKTFISQCMTCKNERCDGKCTVYPNGIPTDIFNGKRKNCKFYKTLIEK